MFSRSGEPARGRQMDFSLLAQTRARVRDMAHFGRGLNEGSLERRSRWPGCEERDKEDHEAFSGSEAGCKAKVTSMNVLIPRYTLAGRFSAVHGREGGSS